MKPKLTVIPYLLAMLMPVLLGLPMFAYSDEIEDILTSKERPAGVIFEIVSDSADALRHAIPQVKKHIKQIRTRFPGLDIAVVSHGQEQFALTKDNNKKYNKVHSEIKSLVKDAGVPVHVCETYASWYNIEPGAFPDYVDVSPTGPAQINDYLALDYILVTID